MEQLETWVKLTAWIVGIIAGFYSIAKNHSDLKDKRKKTQEQKKRRSQSKKRRK